MWLHEPISKKQNQAQAQLEGEKAQVMLWGPLDSDLLRDPSCQGLPCQRVAPKERVPQFRGLLVRPFMFRFNALFKGSQKGGKPERMLETTHTSPGQNDLFPEGGGPADSGGMSFLLQHKKEEANSSAAQMESPTPPT